jgi:hypothetical protein
MRLRKIIVGALMARANQTEKTIRQIMKLVSNFTVDELLDLRFDLEEQIEQLRETGESSAEDFIEPEPTKTLREEWKKCGKPGCQCNTEGKLHGPYLYEYWKEDGRTRSHYVGKSTSKKKRRKA